jgi:hypothetical protein
LHSTTLIFDHKNLNIKSNIQSFQTGGPGWDVPLGRRDSLGASISGSNNNIPAPNNTFQTILTKFKLKGLNIVDLVALSGKLLVLIVFKTYLVYAIKSRSNIVDAASVAIVLRSQLSRAST